MKIGDLARSTGVSVRSLRYYEQRRLLVARRTPGGQRLYEQDAVERVTLIKELFAAGLSSDGVVQLLPCADSGTATPAMVERLICERARIDAEVSRLAATRDRLDQIIVETRRHMLAPTVVVGDSDPPLSR
ncbi:MAG: MerR family transcriptional regulator [Mycobacterium sp.]|jgi:DNA-binding transcriptional MerR regulator|nr:MerR family transcriptional regulator [Mycobacterium sp.]